MSKEGAVGNSGGSFYVFGTQNFCVGRNADGIPHSTAYIGMSKRDFGMQFVKGAWRILVALKDGLALLFLILFFALLYAALSIGGNPAKVSEGALVIALDGQVSEQPAELDPIAALTSTTAPVPEIRQRDVIRALDLAITDPKVKSVVFNLDRFLGGGQVSLGAIAERMDRVKKSGKPVYSFATAYTDDGYLLAAHATEIWMDPLGGTMLTGPGGSQLYFKGLLDQLGIKAHVYRVGTYKSAVEPFLRGDQSPEAKAAATALYDDIWSQWRSNVAKARPQARLDGVLAEPGKTVEAAKGDLSQLALDNKLVDRLGDFIGFGNYLAEKFGKDPDERTGGFAAISMQDLLASHNAASNADAIGVVTVAGEIIDGEAGPGAAAGDTIAAQIYDALDNSDLKALVVRVDSPGGSVMASEKIRRAIAAAKAKKLPVIVSMANLAASGGYWISTPADAIFAEPDTITGSIGIFGILPSGEQALAKWGVTSDGVKTTPLSGEPDVFGGPSADFDRVAQSAIENGYRNFIELVAASRKKTPEQVDAIGQGRVWAGGAARQNGLVDQFGGLDDALADAAKRAGLSPGDWHPVFIEPQPDFFGHLLSGFMPTRLQTAAPMDVFARASQQQKALIGRAAHELRRLGAVEGAQARCIECGAESPVERKEQARNWLEAMSMFITG
jgi:protease IV